MDKTNDKETVLSFLRSVGVMSVALSNENVPMSTILLFAVDDDFTFYFATHTSSRKVGFLRANDKVSFSVWEHNKMLVQADGVAKEVNDETRVHEILEKLTRVVDSLGDFWPPVLQFGSGEYSVFEIKIDKMRILDLKSDTIRVKGSPFSELRV